MRVPTDLESRSLARLSTSLLILVGCAIALAGDRFGRFGYKVAEPTFFEISSEGFRVRQAAADMFRFAKPADRWKVVSVSDVSQTVYLTDAADGPQKLRTDLLAPGMSLYVNKGMRLRLSSINSPIVSWREGSAEAGVRTPLGSWVLVSFRDSQPPVLFAFLDGVGQAIIEGKTGAWSLVVPDYKGWVRVVAPLGDSPAPANTAAALGQLVETVVRDVDLYTGRTPNAVGRDVVADEAGLTVRWQFDLPGATVPQAAMLAPLGGYGLKVLTAVRKVVDDQAGAGPWFVLPGKELQIRFPVRRVPTGRALFVGPPLGKVEPPTKLEQVVELALAGSLSSADSSLKSLSRSTLDAFVSSAFYIEEPFTKQRLPFDASGDGLDRAAAHALLSQTLLVSEKGSSAENSLLTSLLWRRDWQTWTITGSDQNVGRRASAILAIACALSPEPERRLEGALLQAGLAAQRGLARWKARMAGQTAYPPLTEPLAEIRDSLFSFEEPKDDYVRSLVSPIRVYGSTGIEALEPGPSGYAIRVGSGQARQLILGSAFPLTFGPIEGSDAPTVREALGFTIVEPALSSGTGSFMLFVPAWVRVLPLLAQYPKYSEPLR